MVPWPFLALQKFCHSLQILVWPALKDAHSFHQHHISLPHLCKWQGAAVGARLKSSRLPLPTRPATPPPGKICFISWICSWWVHVECCLFPCYWLKILQRIKIKLVGLYFPAFPPSRGTTFALFSGLQYLVRSPKVLGSPRQWFCNCFSLCLMDTLLRLVRAILKIQKFSLTSVLSTENWSLAPFSLIWITLLTCCSKDWYKKHATNLGLLPTVATLLSCEAGHSLPFSFYECLSKGFLFL